MGDLSAHFSRSEFRCKGHGRRGHVAHPTIVAPALVSRLETLRTQQGNRPLRIVSGHRCPWWNARQGGAKDSRHIIGDAVDLEAGYASPAAADRAGFTGIGNSGPWATHVDTRPHRARWSY